MYKVLAFYFSLDLPRTIVWNILKTLHQKDNESRFEEEKLSLKSTTDFESTTEKTLRSRQWRKQYFWIALPYYKHLKIWKMNLLRTLDTDDGKFRCLFWFDAT